MNRLVYDMLELIVYGNSNIQNINRNKIISIKEKFRVYSDEAFILFVQILYPFEFKHKLNLIIFLEKIFQ